MSKGHHQGKGEQGGPDHPAQLEELLPGQGFASEWVFM